MRFTGVLFLGAILGLGITTQTGTAQEPATKEKEALTQNAAAFVKAFQAGDAKAIAALWSADGDFTDTLGRTVKGREAVEKLYTETFELSKGIKVEIYPESVRFVTPDVALEDGVSLAFPADGGPPTRASYHIVHVKKDGKWYLSSVRERPYSPPTNYQHLRKLEWAIGDWVDENDKGGHVGRIGFSWGLDQNFIVSTFTTTFKNVEIGGGSQRIGYDPVTKQIRSWTFHADGGFGEGVWAQNGNKWSIKTTSTGPDGSRTTATNLVTVLDGNTITWQSKDRTVDGKPQPDSPVIKMKRVK